MSENIDLRLNACSLKLGISLTSYQEIKNRLGYKGNITIEQFNVIEKTVENIRKRCDKVTLSTINWYWERCL